MNKRLSQNYVGNFCFNVMYTFVCVYGIGAEKDTPHTYTQTHMCSKNIKIAVVLRQKWNYECNNKGETGHPLKERIEEHRKTVVRGDIEKSGIADHI